MIKTHRALNYKQMGEKWVGGGGPAGNLSPGELATLDFPQEITDSCLSNSSRKLPKEDNPLSLSLVRGIAMNNAITSPKGWPLVKENGHLAWLLEPGARSCFGGGSSGEGSGSGEVIRSESRKSQPGILIFIFGRKKSLP